MELLEGRIAEWRAAILRGRAVDERDADELEGHLREQISDLAVAGLTEDEAFLIAVGRLGHTDAISAEFAREHSDRLWKQLTFTRPDESGRRHPVGLMLGFAALAAVLVRLAMLFANPLSGGVDWLVRDLGLFVLLPLAAYFCVVRRMPWRRVLPVAAVVAVLAIAVNLFPFAPGSATNLLVAIHLPIALWLVAGVAYIGGEVRSAGKRMDFLRFAGEWAVYYAMIALGGMVLLGLTTLVLRPIIPSGVGAVYEWVLTMGAAGAVIVAAWLVEAKKSVIENIAPVLTAIFTPLFAAMLLISAVGYLVAGVWRDFDRDLLTVFDALLLVVLCLILYGISARDGSFSTRAMDVIRFVAVGAAILLDVLVLISMFSRIGEFGFTANRVAALGLNLILLVNLVVTAWLLLRLLGGRMPVIRLERWQTGYLTVFAVWLVLVVLALPPVFGFA